MDNLKQNLHFVVLGGGILLGIIFVVAGIVVRGGTEEQLATANQSLSGKTGVATKGTLDDLERRSGKFESTLDEAETALKGAVSFDNGYEDHSSGNAFYTNEANRKLTNLRDRWAALEVDQKLSTLLEGWVVKRSSGNENADAFWTRMQTEVANPPVDSIRDLQRQLRILEEVLVACERLVAAKLDNGMGVKLLEFKAEPHASLTNNKLDSPWMVTQWEIDIECDPGFAVLLFDELVNPSALTMAKVQDKPDRIGFPNLPMNLQTEMIERPGELKLSIQNDEKAGAYKKANDAGESLAVPDDPENVDPNSTVGKALSESLHKILTEKHPIVMPVRAGIRMQAASFNSEWRAVKPLDDEE